MVIVLSVVTLLVTHKVQQKKKRIELEKADSLKGEQPPVKVIVQEIQTKVIEDRLNLPGSISPWEDLTVQAEVSGQIVAVPVKEGDIVRPGQVLARLDRRDYQRNWDPSPQFLHGKKK